MMTGKALGHGTRPSLGRLLILGDSAQCWMAGLGSGAGIKPREGTWPCCLPKVTQKVLNQELL